MRIVKQQLREMMPYILVFLDVDNLEDIGGLDNYIAHSSVILVYCSSGYFQSKNCMRELVSSTIRKKPVIALVDSDSSHGGLTPKQVHMQLIEADSSYPKWGFDPEVSPPGQALNDHLFEREPIEVGQEGSTPTTCLFADVPCSIHAPVESHWCLPGSHHAPHCRAGPRSRGRHLRRQGAPKSGSQTPSSA
jgi:hypothetical protein